MFSLNRTISRSPGGPFLNLFVSPSAQELREGHNLLTHFYDGVSDEEVEEIDLAMKTRANLTRPFS